MERRHQLIESTDGTDTCFMGYTHASVRQPVGASLRFEEPAIEQPTPPAPPERWWQTVWRILNTDIFDLWRTYGPKGSRSG